MERDGTRAPAARGGRLCPNCAAPVEGQFCPACGQDAASELKPVAVFVREAVVESLDLDGPFWRSARTLFCHPGRLTREYGEGRFVSQVSPLRLYLVMAGLYFFLLPVWGDWTIGAAEPGSSSDTFTANFPPRTALAVMVPSWAMVVWCALIDRRVYYQQTFAFSAHFHVVLMVGFGVAGGLGALLSLVGMFEVGIVPFGLFLLGIPIYGCLALREGFGIGWGRAAASMVVLLTAYVVGMEALVSVLE